VQSANRVSLAKHSDEIVTQIIIANGQNCLAGKEIQIPIYLCYL
jgi:hypothetical protein